ncbi:hypothetical protein T265_02481 [Opisthorchis viverrini]|uniref:Uncharacterized protein n=1 Tax=Opisthorchis viverrini TaxID=6198 RepID=A0A075AIA6_OPIVI|nr:hypothetical protein T265_02481 [Opisthorchis viverrini]KER31299.1 hypothetical protein T265_02481 [Opisthorchis viverrini]
MSQAAHSKTIDDHGLDHEIDGILVSLTPKLLIGSETPALLKTTGGQYKVAKDVPGIPLRFAFRLNNAARCTSKEMAEHEAQHRVKNVSGAYAVERRVVNRVVFRNIWKLRRGK